MEDNLGFFFFAAGFFMLIGGFFGLGAYVLYYTDPCLTQAPGGSIGYPTGWVLGLLQLLMALPPISWILYQCCSACNDMMEHRNTATSSSTRVIGVSTNQVHPTAAMELDQVRSISAPLYQTRDSNVDSIVMVSTQGSFVLDDRQKKALENKQSSKGDLFESKPAFEDVSSLPVFDPETGTFVMDDFTTSGMDTYAAPPTSQDDGILPPDHPPPSSNSHGYL
eukprot:TRINITY_DN746_c1_g3_i3.p2 TRINITY_DN746_c1_g3~~TRINITY_DN746_c1_g3_i3.p2  ORF type:complete len:222 (+),score=52.72 TRINITY_DN746_c1_g3_i3:640-1305(+)